MIPLPVQESLNDRYQRTAHQKLHLVLTGKINVLVNLGLTFFEGRSGLGSFGRSLPSGFIISG